MTDQTPSRADLLAWRERLIAEGVDPALLLVPDRNAEADERARRDEAHALGYREGYRKADERYRALVDAAKPTLWAAINALGAAIAALEDSE